MSSGGPGESSAETLDRYDWAVVGAGPAGIATVGKLLDNGVDGRMIAWIDPRFTVGDFGSKWSQVSSNTKVHRFQRFLRECRSFGYEAHEASFSLSGMEPNGTCALRDVALPLQRITDELRAKVASIESRALSVDREDDHWVVRLERGRLQARKVVLAMGAEPKKLGYGTPTIDLEDALDAGRLARRVGGADIVGVFGSSHSAIMAVRNLLELRDRPRLVVNFYRSPLRYAVDYGDWILYDNTGLKGKTAEWAKEKMDGKDLNGLLRVLSTPESIERYLPQCSKVVYGVGFEPRGISVNGVITTDYDEETGVVAPGLFGCGIAYPKKVVDRAGNVEYDVGLWKFMSHLARVVPVWMNDMQETKAETDVARSSAARPR